MSKMSIAIMLEFGIFGVEILVKGMLLEISKQTPPPLLLCLSERINV